MCYVVFYCELSFSKHVTSVVRRCFYHLRQIRAVRKSLTTESVKTLVHALIASRLDYCNGVFYQLSAVLQSSVERRCTSYHVKAELRPHHNNTARRFTLTAYSSANIVQAEHHCLQVYSWASSILSDEFTCPSRYQYKSSLSSLSNTWKPAGA